MAKKDYFETLCDSEAIYTINKKTLTDNLIRAILSLKNDTKKIALDMRHVQKINSALLIQCLIDNKIKLFNLNSELLAYLAIILKDGFLKSYINFEDFRDDKRELIARHFLVA